MKTAPGELNQSLQQTGNLTADLPDLLRGNDQWRGDAECRIMKKKGIRNDAFFDGQFHKLPDLCSIAKFYGQV